MSSDLDDPVGLCARCIHARIVKTSTSVFWLCALSRTDTRFPRYPRLPVLACSGHEAPKEPAEGEIGL